MVAVVRIPTYANRRSAFNASGIGSDFGCAAGRNLLAVAIGMYSSWRQWLKTRHDTLLGAYAKLPARASASLAASITADSVQND